MITSEFQLNQVLIDPTLAIKTASSAIVKSSNAFVYTNRGQVFTKAAGDMSALTGTIADGYTSSYAFLIDNAGTITTVKGNDVANTATISVSDLPVIDPTKTLLGLVIVKNATGSTFTAGTTALDAASLTVYYTNKLVFGR